MSKWIQQNIRETEACCVQLLKELKKSILDPVLKRLRGPEGSKMQFSDVVSAYNQIQDSYTAKARGAKDVQATVFMNFHPVSITSKNKCGRGEGSRTTIRWSKCAQVREERVAGINVDEKLQTEK